MLGLIDMLMGWNRFQELVTPKHINNHKALCPQLLNEIRSHPKDFKRFIEHKGGCLDQLGKMTLVHLAILHSCDLYDCLEQLSLNIQCSDPWINQHILSRYQHFLHKLILSSEQYQKIRTINLGWNGDMSPHNDYSCKTKMRESPKEYFNFQLLCYCVNMLNQLFTFLQKVPTLGRYYPRNRHPSFDAFVAVASYQVVLLYFSFKFIAKEMLVNHAKYMGSQDEQRFFREVMSLHLERINEELKTLLLNKYYNPIEKGIKIGLLELEKLSEESREALYQLNIIDKENRTRINKKNRQFLGKRIFGKNGAFDANTFEESLLLINTKEYSQTDFESLCDKQNSNHLNTSTTSSRRVLNDCNCN